jgi:hypothetical protein
VKVHQSPDLESEYPIRLSVKGRAIGHTFTFAQARKLSRELSAAVDKIEYHFRCADEHDFMGHIIQCYARGSVKIGERWYCKTHAKGKK